MVDIIKKVNALGLLDQYTIAKSLDQEDEFCKSHNIDIEKGGKAAVIGEIREFGGKKYQKQANGWRPVKKGDQKKEQFQLDLSKHSKQELLDAMTARAKSGVSESDPEMKQLQAEIDKRGAEKKEEFHAGQKIKTATWGEGTIVSGKVEEINGYPMVEIRVKNRSKGELGSGHDDFHNVKVHIKGIEPQSSSSSFTGTHIGDMSKEQKFAAAAKFGIQNPEKLSSQELDKQLSDKNIEAELKKFKESKNSNNSGGFGGGDTGAEDDGSGRAQDEEYKRF